MSFGTSMVMNNLLVLLLAAAVSSTDLRKEGDLMPLETKESYQTTTRMGNTHVLCTTTIVHTDDDQAGCAQIYKTSTTVIVCTTSCIPGLQWDSILDICVPCPTVPPTESPTPTSSPVTEATTSIVTITPTTEPTTTPQPYNCDEPFSCPAPFGGFSDPFNCDLCYACAFGGILQHASCSELGGDATKQNSSAKLDERCTNICPNPITTVAPTTLPTTIEPTSTVPPTTVPTTVPSTTPTPEDPCNFSCVGKANGNYPNPNFCFGYFVCAGEVKFPFWCDAQGEDIGKQFNPVTKKCENRLTAGCVVQCTPGVAL